MTLGGEGHGPPITSTVVRGLSVLEALATSDREGSGLTDLANDAHLDKATTARLVNTLCATGYAYQDPETKKYFLTAKILAIGAAYGNSIHLPNRASRYLGVLRELTDETVHLGILERDHIVYVAKLESTRPVQIASAIGQTMPLHTTALGKAILSAMPDEKATAVIDELELAARTERSIVSKAKLVAELDATRNRGFSIDDRENEDSITCVAAAIVDKAGRQHGALSVSGPSYRMTENIMKFGALVNKLANELGESL